MTYGILWVFIHHIFAHFKTRCFHVIHMMSFKIEFGIFKLCCIVTISIDFNFGTVVTNAKHHVWIDKIVALLWQNHFKLSINVNDVARLIGFHIGIEK